MQFESADTADSYSANKRGDARAATHSAPTHNTRATSAFAAPYAAPTPVVLASNRIVCRPSTTKLWCWGIAVRAQKD